MEHKCKGEIITKMIKLDKLVEGNKLVTKDLTLEHISIKAERVKTCISLAL
jgi:hypothetical protein